MEFGLGVLDAIERAEPALVENLLAVLDYDVSCRQERPGIRCLDPQGNNIRRKFREGARQGRDIAGLRLAVWETGDKIADLGNDEIVAC